MRQLTTTVDINGFPPVVWRVTEVDPGRSFSWQSRRPGMFGGLFAALTRRSANTTSRSQPQDATCEANASALSDLLLRYSVAS
ncbi:MAG: hypothetical protein ABIS06_09510 [Vicinamibacterales bacterium]